MSRVSERLVQLTLRARDFLSKDIRPANEALKELSAEGKRLKESLAETGRARDLARSLRDNQQLSEGLAAAWADARATLSDLTREVGESERASAGQRIALREARQTAEEAERAYKRNQSAIRNLSGELDRLGVDTKSLGVEERRLSDALTQGRAALDANREAVKRRREEEKRGALATQLAAEQARELLQRQREGATATDAHSSSLAAGARYLAAYAAGLLGVTALLGRLRDGVRSMLQTGDQFEGLSQRLESLMGSVGAGEQATAWIKQFAKETPLEVAEVTDAFTLLKSYGLDPMDGSLQALVDKSEQLGGGQEKLSGIVTAVGQAWAKQKLQTEEILQLVERGVPVWDMLARVTGKTTAQLQDMASKGALGRDVIKSLVTEMGKSADGAAAAGMERLSGKVSGLSDLWADFQDRIAKAGALDYVKGRLDALADAAGRLAADGTLDRWAKAVSDALVGVARSVEGAGQWVVRHASEIRALAAAYAAFKLAGMVTAMAQWATSVRLAAAQTSALTIETNALAAAQSRLGVASVLSGGLAKLGGVVEVAAKSFKFLAVRLAGWAGLAVLAHDVGGPLGEMFAKMTPAVREAEASIARLNEQMRQQYVSAQLAATGLEGAAGVQLKTAAQLRYSSEQERAAYLQRLQALEEYRKAQMRVAVYGREIGAITEKEFQGARAELAAVRTAMADVASAADFTASAFKGRLTVGALELVEQFTALRRSGKDADEVLAALGKDFDPGNADQLRDMGVLLQYLGQYGVLSGEQIQQFLIAKLEKLSGSDLVKVQQVAKGVFADLGRGVEALGIVVDASLGQALQQLGIDLGEVRTGFDKGTRETLEAFAEVIRVQQESGRSAQDSARVIEAAYVAARQKIDDPAALTRLDSAFKSAAATAGMTATEISTGMAKARGEVDNAFGAIRDMGDAMQRIGEVGSTMALANIGVAASKAFHEGRMSAQQYAKVQDAIRDRARDLKSAVAEMGEAGGVAGEKLTRSQEMYNDALEDGIVTSEELRRVSGQRMEDERRASGEAMERQRKGMDATQRDMGAMEGFFSGVLTRAREPLAGLSKAALDAYDKLRGIKSADMQLDTSSLDATSRSLQKVNEQLGAVNASLSNPLTSSLGKWAASMQRTSLETQQAYLGQKASLQSLMESYERGDITLARFVSRAKGARHALGLLDDSDLSALESAIKSAEQQMEQLGESSRGTVESLLDELDGLEGREDAIQRRRFDARKRELQAQMAEAQASGDANAISNSARALGLLRQVEAATEQSRVREEQQKRVEANAAAAPSQPESSAARPSTVVRFESPRGGRAVDVAVAAADQSALLGILEDAGLRSL